MGLQYRSEVKVTEFRGLHTEVKDIREVKLIPLADGSYATHTPDQRNWLTLTNNRGIELRRGTALLGQTRQTGGGKITGLGVGTLFDGTQIPFFTHGRKIKYYDVDADDTTEVDSADAIPVAADGEDAYIHPYENIAGSFVYITSPNSPGFKICVSSPGSVVSQQLTTYKGLLKFGQSRGFLINRNGDTPGNRDATTLYVSKVDKVALSQYPAQVTGENVGTGDGVTLTFSDTLVQITAKRTAMYVVITDGVETFVDDRDGNMVGSLGGVGSVNYATGAVSVTFNTAVVNLQAITASYYYEDATSGGILDFTIANPSARVAGEGNLFPQFDGGGRLNSVYPLSTVFYCFHEKKTWQVSIPVDDESGISSISTNLPYREKMGVKSNFGVFGGEDGTYYINTANPNKPEFSRLEFIKKEGVDVGVVTPRLLSKLIDFSPYAFDKAVVHEFQDYDLLSCEQIRNGVADEFNSLTFVQNKKNGAWDLLDYPVSRFADWTGGLLAGDPITNNVFTLFSGFDDDGGAILNYWTSGQTNLEIKGTKRFTRFVVEGLIQQSQRYLVQLSFDGQPWVDVGIVDGEGDYVDRATSIAVGTHTVGAKVGGGGATVFANPYEAEFKVQSPRFENVRVRFEACVLPEDETIVDPLEGGGYVSVHSYAFKDIRQKSLRSLPIRTITV